MNTITLQDCEHFLSCNFDEYEEVIIGENLEIPFLNKDGIMTNTGFETHREFSGNYRKIYLHPSLYYIEMFSEEYRGQIYNLKLHVKRGHQVRFLYSEHNLALLCCIMAEIFQDCRGVNRDYVDYTNVPFPYNVLIPVILGFGRAIGEKIFLKELKPKRMSAILEIMFDWNFLPTTPKTFR